MGVTIQFFGAARTVTGSKYLITWERKGHVTRILVDAGLFQGSREWRERNWVDPDPALLASIDACLLTHAHIDHTGILPRWVKLGLNCPVFCTPSTYDLTKLLLMDSAFLQEEEASYRRKEGKSRHRPPLPLYMVSDAEAALELLRPVAFHREHRIANGVTARWTRMGHILGAGAIQLNLGGEKITFSGDVGRYGVPILKDPEPVELEGTLVIESTYGDRDHPEGDPLDHFAEIIRASAARGGALLVPSFAVGRTQLLLYYLRELKEKRRIPDIPVIIDSPMAHDATVIYSSSPDDYDEEALGILREGKKPFEPSKLYFIRSRQESIALNSIKDPMVLISASGMLSGGRILHHLKHRISDPTTTLLFVGYQPPGGRGAWIKSGAPSLRVLGDEIPIRATIAEMSELSAHGDRSELLRWYQSSKAKPERIFVTHGEESSAEAFARRLREAGASEVRVPSYMDEAVLT